MLALWPDLQSDRPWLQARPSAVSLSLALQMAASSRGSSWRSNLRKSSGRAFQVARLAPNRDKPQVIGMACMARVRWSSPMVLPVMAPVMAHSVLPESILLLVCANRISTGVPPRPLTQSDWVADETRTRRPLKSASRASGFLQNRICAG